MFEIKLIIYIKIDLVLNNQQRLICHKTKPNQNHLEETLSIILIIQGFRSLVFRPSSGVSCRTRELTRNFEPRPLFNPQCVGTCSDSIKHNQVQMLSILVLLLACSQD